MVGWQSDWQHFSNSQSLRTTMKNGCQDTQLHLSWHVKCIQRLIFAGYGNFTNTEQILATFSVLSPHFCMSFFLTLIKGLKAGTHRPNCWTSEAFGETRTRSGTFLFGVFSCGRSFRSRADIVGFDSACKVWGGGLTDVWAIGFSDWRCASESARCVGRAEVMMVMALYRNEPESTQRKCQPMHSHLSRMPSI